MINVVIVDDEDDILEGLATIIDWEGYGFKIAGLARNGMEALGICGMSNPGLLLTDIKMPEMDGLELIKNLRDKHPDIKVVILSGYNDFEYAKKAIKYGVDSYLLKPVDTEELYNELMQAKERILNDQKLKNEKAASRKILQNHLLRSLIFEDAPVGDICGMFTKYDIYSGNMSFCILVAGTSGTDRIFLDKTANMQYADLLRRFIDESFSATLDVCVFEDGEDRFVAVLADKGLGMDKVVLDGLASNIETKGIHGTDAYSIACCGEIVYDPLSIRKSYATAIASYKQRCEYREGRTCCNVQDIVKYVHVHYNEELNLKKVADMFFVNPAYLGQLFKKRTGDHFIDYVNKVRIECAKKLMDENIHSIKKVSEKVGYRSLDYFYRNFKKIVGVNPGEYKRYP